MSTLYTYKNWYVQENIFVNSWLLSKISWLDFVKRRSRRRRSIHIAGMFDGDKAERKSRQGCSGCKLKYWSRLDGIVLRFFLLCLLFLRAAQRVFSREETIWLVVKRQATPFSTIVDHRRQSMWQASKNFFQAVFESLFGALLSRWPTESLPHIVILRRRWFPIKKYIKTTFVQFSHLLFFLFACFIYNLFKR